VPETILAPSILPEGAVTFELVDDQTFSASPNYGKLWTLRNSYADPRWRMKIRLKGLRSAERANILAALARARGRFATVRAGPYQALRGSMSAPEIFTNSDFSSGTTGWSAQYADLFAPGDKTLGVTVYKSGGGAPAIYQAVTPTQYRPHVVRGFIDLPAVDAQNNVGAYTAGTYADGTPNYAAFGNGLFSQLVTPLSAAGANWFPAVWDGNGTSIQQWTRFYLRYASCALCLQVDNATNLLLKSEQLNDTGSWTRAQLNTVTADQAQAPLYNATNSGDKIIEDASVTTPHYLYQTVTVSSAAADYSYSVFLKAGTRTFAYIQIIENTGSTSVYTYVNLSTGALNNNATGANWSNLRMFTEDYGYGWYRFTIIAKKTNAATSLTPLIGLASAVNTGTYTGDNASYIYAWGASLAQSSVPVRYAATTTTALDGTTTQPGPTLYVKGGPASIVPTLKAGDFFEVNGELKQFTSDLDTTSEGIGALQFRPLFGTAPANNAAVIVNKPMGRFMLSDNVQIATFAGGAQAETEITLDEVYYP